MLRSLANLLLPLLLGCPTQEPAQPPPEGEDHQPTAQEPGPAPPNGPPPSVDPRPMDNLRRLGEQARHQNNPAYFDQAEAELATMLEADPCNADALIAMGQLTIERWQFQSVRGGQQNQPDPVALAHYDKALECRPDHYAALQGKGWYYEQIGQYEKALDAYRRVSELQPHDQGMHLVLGTALMQTGRFEEAVEHLDIVVAAHRESGDRQGLMVALDKLGRAHIRLGNHEQAEALLEESVQLMQAMKADGEQDFAACPFVALGQLYRSEGQDEQGAEMFTQAADVEPNKSGSQFRAAQYLFWLGELDQARIYADRALIIEQRDDYRQLREQIDRAAAGGLAPGDQVSAEAAFDAATRAFDRYAFDQAGAFVQQSLAAEPSTPAKVLEAMVALMQARYDAVDTLLSEAEGLGHDPCSVSIGRGHLLVAQKDYKEAKRSFRTCIGRVAQMDGMKGLEMEPAGWPWLQYKLAHLGMAWVNTNEAQHSKAIEYFDKVLRYQPTDRFALIGKGNALNAMGDLDGAEQHLRRVIAIDPDNMYAIAELGLVELNRGEVESAQQSFQRAMELEPQSYTCPHEGLGMVYMRQGQTDKAKEHFEKAISINPDIEYKKYNGLAAIYMEEGRYDEAEALLRKSMENYPHDPEAAELLEKLESMQGE